LTDFNLQAGKIPKHIAFVMDGNRRYARRNHLSSVVHGHSMGFDKLTNVLDWCRELGVEEVTLYAFSIDNFKRDKEEVNGLMSMAEEKFASLLNERQSYLDTKMCSLMIALFRDRLHDRQICFRFFGDLSLLSPRIRSLISKIEELTQDHTK